MRTDIKTLITEITDETELKALSKEIPALIDSRLKDLVIERQSAEIAELMSKIEQLETKLEEVETAPNV